MQERSKSNLESVVAGNEVMHHIDVKAYSAMITAELARVSASGAAKSNSAALQKLLLASLSKQVKNNTLEKKVYRYLIRITMPREPGFLTRWGSYLHRYQQINAVERAMRGKSDIERLQYVMKSLKADYGIVTRLHAKDSQQFEGQEQEQVAKNGFIALTEGQRDYIGDDGNFTDLVTIAAYSPTEDSRAKILGELQLYGFDLYEPETNLQPKQVGHICLIGTAIQAQRAA